MKKQNLLRASTLLITMISCSPPPEDEPPASLETPAALTGRPNVLLIAVDDLNDWVGHLGGHPQARTPNIDALARQGMRFSHAYAASAVCNASRAALMSGKRPSTTGIYDNNIDWRPLLPAGQMLPAQFRKAGYLVAGSGKIYHHGMERPSEWDRYSPFPIMSGWAPCDTNHVVAASGDMKYAIGDCVDAETTDYKNSGWIIDRLRETQSKPFLFALGIFRPHLHWYVPKKYYDMYPLDQIQLPPYRSDDLNDLPASGRAMASGHSNHEAILAAGTQHWKALVRAYLASVSYADAQVGRVMAALNASPYKNNTIVVLYSDHGWHLGEKHHWMKQTLWEEATRVPYIWVVPGLTTPGSSTGKTVDLMSLYPTLMSLAGLPVPSHVEGTSIRPLLANPAATWNSPGVMTYQFKNHAVRKGDWRYIRYRDGGEELYDHATDPNEWTNLASRSGMAAVKNNLAAFMPTVNVPPANP
jgi:arylsulfatase A-like enzyme